MSERATRVVVFAPNWLGDAVMALPAIQTIRAAHPDAHLAVAARPSVAALFAMVPGIDDVIALESRAGLSSVRQWRRDAAALRAQRFDLAVLLPNAFLAAWIAAQAGIPDRRGFATDVRGRWLTTPVRRPREGMHQADYYLALTSALGWAPGPRVATVVPPTVAVEDARAHLPTRPFAVLAPGAAYGRAKQWPPESYAALAAMFLSTRRLPSVVVGAGADRLAGEEMQAALTSVPGGAAASASLVNLIGRTDLPTLAAVLSLAHVVVANDSGAMHLAAAVGAPVVAIFGATNEHHTAPLPGALAAPAPRLATAPVWCRPCLLRECPLGHQCMRGVDPQLVATLVP